MRHLLLSNSLPTAIGRSGLAGPSLDLNFADTKSLVDSVSGRSLIDFTRTTDGTYVDSQGIVRAAVNNLLTYSNYPEQGFAPTRVLPIGGGSTANAATAPDGTVSAIKVVEDTSAATTHLFNYSTAVVGGLVYTISIYLKAAERSWALVLVGGTTFGTHGVYVDLTNCVAGTTVGSPIATSVTSIGNGWCRVSVT